MSYIKRLIDRLISLQDWVIKRDEYARYMMDTEAEGKKGLLVVLGKDGGRFPIEVLGKRIKWSSSERDYLHKVTMSEDTFLDIVSGLSTLDEKFTLGHIDIQGPNWMLHAKKWRDGFKRMGYLFRLIRRV